MDWTREDLLALADQAIKAASASGDRPDLDCMGELLWDVAIGYAGGVCTPGGPPTDRCNVQGIVGHVCDTFGLWRSNGRRWAPGYATDMAEAALRLARTPQP